MHESARDIRRGLATAVGVVAVCAAGASAQEPSPVVLPTRPYSAASPFNLPVGDDPVVLETSDTIVANSFLTDGVPSALSTARDESINYDHPVYVARGDDPLVTLSIPGKALDGMQINLPAYARAAGGSDGHLGVVTPDGWEVDLWQAQRVDETTVSATIGYRQRAAGLGIVTDAMLWDRTDPENPRSINPDLGGGVAAMWGLRAGIIQADEMLAGRIDHALFVVIPRGRSGHVYPALRSDVTGNPDGPQMGQRYWLDLSDEEIDATAAPDWEKTIAKAVHDYGAYFGDTGGNGFGFMLESSTPYVAAGVPNPWDVFWPSQGVEKDPFWGYHAVPSATEIWSHLRAIAPPPEWVADPPPPPEPDPAPQAPPAPGGDAAPSAGSPDAGPPAQSG